MQDLRDFRGWQLQLRGILPPPPPQANTLAPPLLVCAVYDVSHLLPQPQPTTFNPTLSHNMYCHVTTNIQQHHYHYHTTPHQVSNANSTSTILAKCLAENCASPDNGTQGGRGGGGGTPTHFFSDRNLLWQNYYHNGVEVLSSSRYVTDLTSKKKKKSPQKGQIHRGMPPATPRRRAWLQNVMHAHSSIHSWLHKPCHTQHNPYPS